MSQPLADNLRIDALPEELGSVRMPEVMKPNLEPALLSEAPECGWKIIRRPRATVWQRANEVLVLVILPKKHLQLVLSLAVVVQHINSEPRKADRPPFPVLGHLFP